MGIIAGAVAGTILFAVFGGWLYKKQQDWDLTPVGSEDAVVDNGLENRELQILTKKLRDAIFDCERSVAECEKQIDNICANQLHLLEEVGKISFVEVKDKPLFFEFKNPISGVRHFYYMRDLNTQIAADVLEKTQRIAQKYGKQIELMVTQKAFFERLIVSHKENLDRVLGVNKIGGQMEKVLLHKEKLSSLNENNKLEEKAIYNELIIKDINSELEHQEECMRQYISLNEKYENPEDGGVDEKIKVEIEEIIKQLEKP